MADATEAMWKLAHALHSQPCPLCHGQARAEGRLAGMEEAALAIRSAQMTAIAPAEELELNDCDNCGRSYERLTEGCEECLGVRAALIDAYSIKAELRRARTTKEG